MSIAEQLAAALSALLSLNRTQGVTDADYEAAEARADEALARYDAESAQAAYEAQLDTDDDTFKVLECDYEVCDSHGNNVTSQVVTE